MVSILVDTLTNPANLLDQFGISSAPAIAFEKYSVARPANERRSSERSSRRSWSTRRRSSSSCGRMRC